MFGSLLGGLVGGIGQAKAAKESAKVSREALAQQQKQLDRSWDAVDPYMKTGGRALSRLEDPEAFRTSPGYDFRLKQGIDGVTQNKAFGGLMRSGGAMKAVADYSSNLASDEYNRWFGQQSALAGMGLQGAGIGAGVAQNQAQAIGQNATNQANAKMAGANAWAGVAGQIGGAADRLMSSYG